MDVELSVPAQRSSEEEDELQRSVKKFKENNGARSFLPPRKLVSYKDSLVGDIPGACEQAFKFSKDWEEDYESETEMEPLTEGMAKVKLSKETKARIRAPWSRALIVNVYRRSIGFHYLTFKINAFWKPMAKMDCVTLGKGFFLESCGLKVKEPNRDVVARVSLKSNETNGKVQPELDYGPWMVVTRKKKNLGRMGKANGPIKTNTPTQVEFKGNLDLSQASVHVEASEDLNKSVHSDLADSNSETARVVAGLNTHSALEMRKDCMMEDCLENPSAGCQLDPRHISGNKRKAITKNKGKGSEGLGIRNSKNSKSHKQLPNNFEGKSGLLLLSKELGSDNQVDNGEFFDRTNTTAKIRVSNLVQEPSGGYPRGDNSSDKSGANENTGWFEEELRQAWKHLFPIAPESISLGDLILEHKAWALTPNQWWNFLTDVPGISCEASEELSRHMRPSVMPHWDESKWIIQERKLVDFRGMATAHLGNHSTLKLIQIMAPVQKCDVLLSCREDNIGIQKHMIIWKPNWVASKDLLRRMGWSMVEAAPY
nr:hypothetical protein CFP56_14687 [Quercus suber]